MFLAKVAVLASLPSKASKGHLPRVTFQGSPSKGHLPRVTFHELPSESPKFTFQESESPSKASLAHLRSLTSKPEHSAVLAIDKTQQHVQAVPAIDMQDVIGPQVRSFPRIIEHTTAEFNTQQKKQAAQDTTQEAEKQAAQNTTREADKDAQNTAQQVALAAQKAVQAIQQASQQLIARGIQPERAVTNSTLRSDKEDYDALAPSGSNTQPFIHHEFSPCFFELPAKH
ncbi:hypothetical protein CHU98_g1259 [Xylaria longipes]|nr:hypothetical protein CHU98_g1259 [Xylaria longipes]